MSTVTCDEVVRALKKHGLSSSARVLAGMLKTDSRAIATALRAAVNDGRVTATYRKDRAFYRFVRLTAKAQGDQAPRAPNTHN